MARFTDNIEDSFEIVAEGDHKRADAFLADETGKSRSLISDLMEQGFVTVNGAPCIKKYKVKSGDVFEIKMPKEEAPSLEPKDIPFDVIHETDSYVVINKPAGLTVHPAPGNFDNTLVNALLFRFNINDDNDFRPGIVHRLDKDTSGLIIVAKDRDSREKLAKMFADRLVDKRYYALCQGNPKWDHKIIEAPIGRHKTNRKKQAVTEEGRDAKSEVWVKERHDRFFAAEIKIYTGRTHQIRVHMAHINCPLMGDEVYGNKSAKGFKINRQALHSWKLAFKCPFTGEDVSYEAPIPEDMKI